MNISEIDGTWDYATLPENVKIGEGCRIERSGSFGRFRSRQVPGLVLGNRVRAHTWTAFNVEPDGVLEIGDDCVLVGALFMCAQRITVGRRVLISYNVSIADSDFHPRDPELRRMDAIALCPEGDPSRRPPVTSRPVVIEDDVVIGIGAIILKGTYIGRGARIGAGAVITSRIPPGAHVLGNPARIVGAEKGFNHVASEYAAS
jgi:acetyltransferase-like isoleucine patch superfamily enzyme